MEYIEGMGHGDSMKKQCGKKESKNKRFEDLFESQIKERNLPKFEREIKLIPGRQFRFDFVNEYYCIAIEIQGAVFVKGAHSTGVGITRDCEKQTLAILEGYTVFHFTTGQVKEGKAIEWLSNYFVNRLNYKEYKLPRRI